MRTERVIDLAGDLDLEHLPVLTKQVGAFLAVGPADRYVVDMSDVGFVDSSGLAVLVRIRTAAAEHDGSVLLVDPPSRCRRLLEATGITDLFEIGVRHRPTGF